MPYVDAQGWPHLRSLEKIAGVQPGPRRSSFEAQQAHPTKVAVRFLKVEPKLGQEVPEGD